MESTGKKTTAYLHMKFRVPPVKNDWPKGVKNIDHYGTFTVSSEIHTQVSHLKTSANPFSEIWMTHLLNNQLSNQITDSMEQSLSSEANIPQSKNSLYFT
jgi:hypothetical protein